MRLLNANTLMVEQFPPNNIPPYAILSHTWEDDEVTFQDMECGSSSTKAGYNKLRDSCKQALVDNLQYIWVDTCCIDKTSSAELSEAINTMFRWYKEAVVCYAFLADVPDDTAFDDKSPFARSRWFTRGWTLQELLAPKEVEFFSSTWKHIGSKSQMDEIISRISGIDEQVLRGRPLDRVSIASRMSWAAKRETTRGEDKAYSLLGIFSVHIPLLYGEGAESAFLRLQEELIRTSDDQSIFAWHLIEASLEQLSRGFESQNMHLLASSPADFMFCNGIVTCSPFRKTSPFFMTNAGIRIDVPILYDYEGNPARRRSYAVLNCRWSRDYWNVLTIPVDILGQTCSRSRPAIRLYSLSNTVARSFRRTLYFEVRQSHRHAVFQPLDSELSEFTECILILRSLPPGYHIVSVEPSHVWESWSSTSGRMIHRPRRMDHVPDAVITITNESSHDTPFRSLQILVKGKSSIRNNCTKHVVVLAESGAAIFPRLDDPPRSPWRYCISYRKHNLFSKTCSLYMWHHLDQQYQNEMDTVDVFLDYSTFRRAKSAWAHWQNWTESVGLGTLQLMCLLFWVTSCIPLGLAIRFRGLGNWTFFIMWPASILSLCGELAVTWKRLHWLRDYLLFCYVLASATLVAVVLTRSIIPVFLLVSILMVPTLLVILFSMRKWFQQCFHRRAFPLFRLAVWVEETLIPVVLGKRRMMADPTFDRDYM